MWETLVVQPIFNLLVVIYALLPGHDFGVAIIIFTIVVRLLMWPLVKKQLRHTKAMRELQPEIKKVKAKTKGDRQKEAQLLMELYKEREISPFGSIGILLIQIPILIGLFQGLQRLSSDANTLVELSYGWVKQIGNMPSIIADISNFDQHLFGVIDLSKRAFQDGTIYWPLMILAILAAVFQYFQSRQLMPDDGKSRSLRQILKDESKGQQADQSEINAAMGRNMRFIFPVLTGFLAATFPGALSLYWATGSAFAVVQQHYILNKDVEDMEKVKIKTVTEKPATKKAKKKRKK